MIESLIVYVVVWGTGIGTMYVVSDLLRRQGGGR